MTDGFVAAREDHEAPTASAVQRVLLVEGESAAPEELLRALGEAGFDVVVAACGASVSTRLKENDFDLVILDARLPDAWGLDVIRAIRGGGDEVPVIVFGEGDSEAERVLSLDLGADDYVRTPLSPRELISRGRAILRRVRRGRTDTSEIRDIGALRIDVARHEVSLGRRPVDVTASEFRFLALLSASPGTVFTRRQIMEHLWAGPYFGDGHPVDTHVLNLRRKIEADPASPTRLLTVRGVGFRLVAPAGED